MEQYIAEFVGTFLLILFGCGVVANVVLPKTGGHNSGYVVITFGWAMAVFLGVYACTYLGGKGHLNPAVTLALAILGKLDWHIVPGYIAAQFLGAMLGAGVTWLVYAKHFEAEPNADNKLGVFSTGPGISNVFFNLISEAVGTFALVLGALFIAQPSNTAGSFSLGTLDALPVALLVLGIGMSLGGPTGYAINPARDLGPRIMHFLLPIPGKRDSNWSYSWIPVVGPIAGALLATWIFNLLS